MPKSTRTFCTKNIRGVLFAETSGLTSSQFASVLATSGTTSAESESTGNSWKFSHIVEAFCTQWCDAALTARMSRPRNLKLLQQQLIILTCLNSPRLPLALKIQFHGMTRIHRLLSMKMITMTTTKKTLTGALVSVTVSWMTLHTQLTLRQMTQNFLMPPQLYASASRSTSTFGSCQECQRPFSCCWHLCF